MSTPYATIVVAMVARKVDKSIWFFDRGSGNRSRLVASPSAGGSQNWRQARRSLPTSRLHRTNPAVEVRMADVIRENNSTVRICTLSG
jgi:hypothetical protein